jgi:drug/metabolite transporter (DMT)-like permease
MTRPSLLRFVCLGLIWGTSYTFIKLADAGLTPGQLVLGRLAIGLVTLLVIIRAGRVALPRLGPVWWHFCATAVLGMVAPFLLLAWGEERTSAAMAGVLIASLPLVTLAAVTVLLPAERASWQKITGLLAGFAGVVIIFAPWQGRTGTLGGQFAVVGAAACYAMQTVYIRKFLSPRGIPALALAAAQLSVATLIQAAVTPALPWHAAHLTWKVVLSVLVLGALGSAVAYTLYFRLIADLGATTASSVNYLVPVVAISASVIVLSDTVTWNMFCGVALVLAGLAFAERRRLALPRASGAGAAPAPEPAPGPAPEPAPGERATA